jgi:hypothetical protein
MSIFAPERLDQLVISSRRAYRSQARDSFEHTKNGFGSLLGSAVLLTPMALLLKYPTGMPPSLPEAISIVSATAGVAVFSKAGGDFMDATISGGKAIASAATNVAARTARTVRNTFMAPAPLLQA